MVLGRGEGSLRVMRGWQFRRVALLGRSSRPPPGESRLVLRGHSGADRLLAEQHRAAPGGDEVRANVARAEDIRDGDGPAAAMLRRRVTELMEPYTASGLRDRG